MARSLIAHHRHQNRSTNWRGRAVTVMGLGRHGGGIGAALYLAERGALVTISDMASHAELADSLTALRDVPIAALKLEGHDAADFGGTDSGLPRTVVVNPAVRPDHPCLQLARDRGATLTSEIEIFLRACRAHVIGVTGSNGKSTTCAMLAAMLSRAGRRVWLGGNFGGSLLGDVDRMTADDWVVLELSSFQLAHLSEDVPLPEIALATNCTPNHLDWHASLGEYEAAKLRLFDSRSHGWTAVLNQHDPQVAQWASQWPLQRTVPSGAELRSAWPLSDVPPLRIAGAHNRQNAACAAAAAEAAGAGQATIAEAIEEFRGLPHRLEFVAEVDGRRFYNDSKSTTPAATLAALSALDRPIWLLAGGHSKGADFAGLARAIAQRACGAALFGSARKELDRAILACDASFQIFTGEHLREALGWCCAQARAGDAVLISPACASYDQFRDFTARGEAFCELVRAISHGA